VPAIEDPQQKPAEDRGVILVVHGDRKTQRTIHRILGATLYTIDAVDNVAQAAKLLRQHVPALVVIDHQVLGDDAGQEFVVEASDAGTTGCLVLADSGDTTDIPRLFATGSLTNLLTHPMPVLAEELTVTALKLLRNDIFGLDKYMSWGVEAHTFALTNTVDRTEAVDALARDVREFGLGPRVASMASLVADELLSNALYDAPVDEDGQPTRAAESRHLARALSGRECVTLRYACDARYLAIEVTDLFGSLDRRTILQYLAKAARRGDMDKVDFGGTGAGMGIALSYSCCNHLVFNLSPGMRTEAIGLIDVRFKPSQLRSMVPSFNVFLQGGGEQ